jgi:hypothetical protein
MPRRGTIQWSFAGTKERGDEEHHLRAGCAAAVTLAGPAYAAAPSGEVARICRRQALDTYPTPRIGTMNGVATAQREFFRDCVAKMREEDGN